MIFTFLFSKVMEIYMSTKRERLQYPIAKTVVTFIQHAVLNKKGHRHGSGGTAQGREREEAWYRQYVASIRQNCVMVLFCL